MTLVSYVPKAKKVVNLLSTMHNVVRTNPGKCRRVYHYYEARSETLGK